jgi:hypothetical protein
MANRFPLVLDGTVLKELPSGDNIDMTGSGLANLSALSVTNALSGASVSVTGALSGASASITGNVNIAAQGDLRLEDASGGQYIAIQAPATVATNVTLTLPADDGTASQYLQTDGSGVLSWSTVAASFSPYNAWAVKTSAYTAVSKDQLIVNSGSAVTITLPSSPSVGDTVIIKNVGAGTVTLGRNGSNFESSAQDATLLTTKAAQIVYVDGTLGWKEI